VTKDVSTSAANDPRNIMAPNRKESVAFAVSSEAAFILLYYWVPLPPVRLPGADLKERSGCTMDWLAAGNPLSCRCWRTAERARRFSSHNELRPKTVSSISKLF
jgi:hypothetical protein